jgi:hypothetical protein
LRFHALVNTEGLFSGVDNHPTVRTVLNVLLKLTPDFRTYRLVQKVV